MGILPCDESDIIEVGLSLLEMRLRLQARQTQPTMRLAVA
jgi:hypothetical protein